MQDRAGQAAPLRVVEEHRVQHVARGRIEAEADVGEPEDDLDLGQLGRDRRDRVEGLDAEPAVVGIAGADREGQGIDQQVVAGQAMALAGEGDQAARERELGRGVLGHAGLVDRQRDHRGAELARELEAPVRRLLAVLEIDRVQHRLAAIERERRLEHRQFGRIQHQRAVDRAAQAAHHRRHVGHLVAPDISGANVERVRAFLDLGAADRDAGVPVLCRLALAERLRAVGVAALADRQIGLLLAQRHGAVERGELRRAPRPRAVSAAAGSRPRRAAAASGRAPGCGRPWCRSSRRSAPRRPRRRSARASRRARRRPSG